ncbi:MAG: Short-chain dehydrogenase/reductase [Myxococcaceae bacterium]|nr:Short-chain dehydrogenase/reductase [Myxococcaceae bacterium]
MSERVVLVTGSRKGIGRGLCEHFLEQGYRVVGCSREASDLSSPRYEHHCLDVSDEAKVARMMSEIRRTHGGLHAVVNNAGVAAMNHVMLTPISTVRTVLDTNVIGTFLVCREAAKLMRKSGGRIVNFATVATPLNLEGEAAYAASKAAVESLTRVMSREFAGFGITVNAVGPTPVPTDLIRSVPAQKMAALLARQAIPRMGELRDIINVVDFFLRDGSDFVTGQTIYLGGVV